MTDLVIPGILLLIIGGLLSLFWVKRSEARYLKLVEESEQRYRSLFAHNPDIAYSVNLEGFFIDANETALKISKYTLPELRHLNFLQLLTDEDQMRTLDYFQKTTEGVPQHFEITLVAKDKQHVRLAVTSIPMVINGHVAGVHGIAKDITEQVRAEKALRESEERYTLLQHSLYRFSQHLGRVMLVSELEAKLLQEVQNVLDLQAALLEAEDEFTAYDVKSGPTPVNWPDVQQTLRAANAASPELGAWVPLAAGSLVHIGSSQCGHRRWLWLGTRELSESELKWLTTISYSVSLLYDNLQAIEGLAKELERVILQEEAPPWILRLLFNLAEKERVALSADLHDAALQDQITWYRRLEALGKAPNLPPALRTEVQQIEQGLLDVIHQIRLTCNELRPPLLVELGLVPALDSLFDHTQLHCDYVIRFDATRVVAPVGEEQMVAIYRVVQELLTNAAKHSQASLVTITLASVPNGVEFVYTDNGVGFDLTQRTRYTVQMGLAGIENRVRSLGGEIAWRSAVGDGLSMKFVLPTQDRTYLRPYVTWTERGSR